MAADPRFFPHAGPQPLGAVLAVLDETCAVDTPDRVFAGVAPLGEAGPENISYCEGVRNAASLRRTGAGAVFVQESLREAVPQGCIALVVRMPALAFSRVAALFHPAPKPPPGVHPTAVLGTDVELGPGVHVAPYAVIGDGARLGADCIIGPHAVVGAGVVLGEGCHLHAHSSISHAICGRFVVLHPGARVGQEGFGFVPTPDGRFVTMPQFGLVRLEDHVEIGANACVDRGSHADTVLGAGTRLDNLVQVGHNVRTGPGCVLVAQVGVSGSTTLGRYVTLAGQAGVTGHLTIGDGARIGAQAGVMRDVPPGAEMLGSPALPVKEAMRAMTMMKRLAAQSRGGARDGEKE
jgi:UDP-3-O-[3-hydroxymyristoyl] glucosamine N-acyltransferase